MTAKRIPVVLSPLLLFASDLKACMFCDEASVRTLTFVVIFLSLFCAGMAFFALAYSRRGKPSADAGLRVLEAEGIEFKSEVKHV